jgi:hypothetical protein
MLRKTSPRLDRAVRLAIIQKVWEKADVVPGFNPRIWRKDCCGALIHKIQYGNRKSAFGWELDHVVLKSQGGSNRLSNLRPLQWKNNACRQVGELACSVTSSAAYLKGVKEVLQKRAFPR